MGRVNVNDVAQWKSGGLHFMFEVANVGIGDMTYAGDGKVSMMLVFPVPGSVVAIRGSQTDKVIDPPDSFPLDECDTVGEFERLLYDKSNVI